MSKRNLFAFFSFVAVAFVAYRDCFGIFIPSDNYTIFYLFDKEGISGSIKNFGPYFFYFPFIFCLYKIIGLSAFGWICISVILHAVNAYLVFLLTKQIANALLQIQTQLLPFFAGLIFLISPYQTEAILWTPSNMGFLISTALSLFSLLLLLKHFESSEKTLLYISSIVFLLAVYSWEASFVIPGISTVLFMMYRVQNKTALSFKYFSIRLLFPQVSIVLSYLLVTKFLFGSWLWHSGSFDTSFPFSLLAGTAVKYIVKFFVFYRYLPLSSADELLRSVFSNHSVVLLIFLFAGILFFSGILFLIKKKSIRELSVLTFFVCFMISLLPVLSLDSSFLKYIYPDRYGYLPSVFFYVFLSCSAFFLFKKIAPFILAGYSVLCWALLSQTIPVWNAANDHCNKLTEAYKPFLNYDKVYILNAPAYYKGVAAFRSAFPETIFEKLNHSPTDKILVISGFYQESDADSVTSVSVNGNTITVTGQKKQTPFFSSNGGWARSYETDEYSVKFNPTGSAYTLTFKQEIHKNSAFIYTVNGIWKKAG